MPRWTPVVIAVVALAILFAAISLPGSLSGAIAFERGQSLEKAGKYREAVSQYETAQKHFPDSLQITARLAIAQYRSGDAASSFARLGKLEGKELDKETISEINSIVDEFQAKSSREGLPK